MPGWVLLYICMQRDFGPYVILFPNINVWTIYGSVHTEVIPEFQGEFSYLIIENCILSPSLVYKKEQYTCTHQALLGRLIYWRPVRHGPGSPNKILISAIYFIKNMSFWPLLWNQCVLFHYLWGPIVETLWISITKFQCPTLAILVERIHIIMPRLVPVKKNLYSATTIRSVSCFSVFASFLSFKIDGVLEKADTSIYSHTKVNERSPRDIMNSVENIKNGSLIPVMSFRNLTDWFLPTYLILSDPFC